VNEPPPSMLHRKWAQAGGGRLQSTGEVSMNLKSLIPIGRERGMARPEWSPFVNLQREIDRIFEEFARGLPSLGSSDLMPRMDVTESDGEIEITAELPGLEEKDVEITVSDNVLTVRGEKKAEAEEKKKDYRLVERSYGS